MKHLLYLFLLFALISNLTGQKEYKYEFEKKETDEDKRGTYQAFIYNFHIDKVSGLTNLLLTNDYPKMDDFGEQFEIRYGLGKRNKRINPIINFSYYRRTTEPSDVLLNSANFSGLSLGIGAEWNLLKSKMLFLKPMFMINANRYKLNFIENSNVSTIDGLLNSNYKEYSFRSTQFPIQAGLNFGCTFKLGGTSIGLLIGGGYMLNWTNQNWTFGQGIIVEDTINLSSPYLSGGLITSID